MCGRTILFFLSTSAMILTASAFKTNRTCSEESALPCVNVTVPIFDTLDLNLYSPDDENIAIRFKSAEDTGVARKMKMGSIVQFLLVPAFALAGIIPWIVPGLVMIVTLVGMVNQMVFTSALVMLIRTYVFDKTPEEHILYLNTGYDKKM